MSDVETTVKRFFCEGESIQMINRRLAELFIRVQRIHFSGWRLVDN
jgi:hypothetical protein